MAKPIKNVKRTLVITALCSIVLLALAFELTVQTPLDIIGLGPLQAETTTQSEIQTTSTMRVGVVTFNKADITVEVADTPELWAQGLSGRAMLPHGSGMLFVFDRDSEWGFWMKDMQFSIDIVWLDVRGRVITVAHDVSPGTYPQSFYPTAPARYVLELPSGFAQEQGIVESAELVVQY